MFDNTLDEADLAAMVRIAPEATTFLKAFAHEGRLLMLCHLASGEKSVTELEDLLASRQAAVSQQLARLRHEGLVDFRRDGKAIYYRLKDPKVVQLLEAVRAVFCEVSAAEA